MEFGIVKMRFIVAISLMGAVVVHSKNTTEFRLPTNFKPVSYRLNVTTHLEGKFTFEGVVDIKITCLQATNVIVLHSEKLKIDTKSVVIADGIGKIVPVTGVSFVPQKQLMYVKSSQNMISGDEYVLTIPFMGNITDSLKGYYKSSYIDKETNQMRWLAITQFEADNARLAFPCFDEPAMKAKFKITLGHQKDLTAVSNMHVIKTTLMTSNPDYVFDEFEDSVLMSTYLVAYMVSDFAYIESDGENDNVKFRIFTKKDTVGHTELAKNTGPLVLKYYEDYFDEKFPLSKQDMVAIPHLLSIAMENWGLVTFRESVLLIDPDVATIDNIHYVVEVIAHELAHQWFGNLVTMKWWTDIWLNEAFATYVGTRGVDHLYPEWNFLQLKIVEDFINVLDVDSFQSSHPVSVSIENPDEIAQIFDTISYKKGSFLLHMMNMFLGEETFKQGIRNYIDQHKFANVEQDDLWSTLTDEAHRIGSLPQNMSVKEIMDTWTLQTGYPVLKVIRDYSSDTVTLSQERFLSSKLNGTDKKSCWWVPLTMTTSTEMNFSQTKAATWLKCNDTRTMTLTKDNEWVIFNLQIAGLFRVLYDTRNWMGIISTLNNPNEFKKIHTLNRVQLIEDSLTFSQIGDMDYDITFQLLNYLKHEKECLPWLAALSGLGPINKLLKRTPNHGVFQNFMKRILSTVYEQFQNMLFKLERFEDIRFKNQIVTQACVYEMKHCTKQSLMLFHKWMKSDKPDYNDILPRELKSTIYCQALKYGGVDEWDFLWERYQRSNIESEKKKHLSALGCSSETWLLNRYLNWTIGANATIHKNDAISVFSFVASTDVGFYVAKEFLYRRSNELSEYFKSQGDVLGIYVNVIGSQIKTTEELDEIQKFIKKYSTHLIGADLIVNQIKNRHSHNVMLLSKFKMLN